MLGLGNVIWLSLGVLSCGFPAVAQSQQPPVVEAPGSAPPVVPQQPLAGSISGTVIDETGAVIIGARVTLTHGDQSAPREAVSGDSGQFSFANVVPGTFQITITATGFAPQTTSGVLHPAENYIAPTNRLSPAALTTEVEVRVSPVEIAEAQLKAQEKQRILGVIPNFYVSYVPDAAPLSSKQKFQLAWRSTIDPVTFVLTGAAAGVQQAYNEFSGYGQGAVGYAKRFGANYADTVTSTFIGGAILPSLLKQDPRYFYKGTGSAKSRFLYAIANAVICKGDNRHWQPNYSAILGGIASGAISNLYYPPQDRGTALVFENMAIGTGETALINVFQEFLVKRFTTHVPKTDPKHQP
jgi:hypothetical protein